MSIKCQKSFTLSVVTAPPGLVSYWTLNETGVNTRLDSKGPNNLTPGIGGHGTVTDGAGIISNALKIAVSGSGQYIERADVGVLPLDATRGFTVCGWFFIPGTAFGSVSSQPFNLFCGGDVTTGSNSKNRVQITRGFNSLNFLFSDQVIPVSAQVTLTPAFAAWNFYAAWYDPVAGRIYFERNADGTIVDAAFIGSIYAVASSWMFIGGGTGNGYLVDETGFWNGVLTAADRAYLYNAGAGRTYPDVPYP